MARLKPSIVLACGARFGPGKAALLESIRDTGSISAAARGMGMSYKRAWMLIDSITRAFEEPAVEAATGGYGGGGARLTGFDLDLLDRYRRMGGPRAGRVRGRPRGARSRRPADIRSEGLTRGPPTGTRYGEAAVTPSGARRRRSVADRSLGAARAPLRTAVPCWAVPGTVPPSASRGARPGAAA